MWDWSGYVLLFISALGAATLLPLQSEAALVGLLLTEQYSTVWLLAVATTGNVLGSWVNWWLGQKIEHWQTHRWFPISPAALAKAGMRYQRYGYLTLLLSWMPIIGDPLTLVAGIMREPLWRFLLLVTLAKGGRYLVVTALSLPSS